MSIPYEITTAPTVAEHITIPEAKIIVRSDGDTAEEDAFLARLITAARETVERHTGRILLPQVWRSTRFYWPTNRYFSLPTAPVNDITSFVYHTASGAQTLPTDAYWLIKYPDRRPIVSLADGVSWPTEPLSFPGVVVMFTCGYLAVPAMLREAMISLIAYWYDNRESAIASTQYKAEVSVLPLRYQELINPYILST